MPESVPIAVKLSGITRRFGTFVALDNVSLAVRPGTMHALLGENGAGKSTLMNILFGLLQPDTGTLSLSGQPTKLPSPRAAQRHGIGMVHQHFKLVPTLTVEENLALALHQNLRTVRTQVTATLSSLNWSLPLKEKIATLSVGQQQRVEIVKALMLASTGNSERRILILDEPTAVLTPPEVDALFATLTALKNDRTAIILITHKLHEVQHHADALTILRRGKTVYEGPAKEKSPDQLAELMVGSHVDIPTAPHLKAQGLQSLGSPPPLLAQPLLQLENLSANPLTNANLTVHRGEIVGIAGVDGNGQSDLIAAIIGSHPISSGKITLNDKPLQHVPIRERLKSISYIPEDRHTQAIVLPMSVTQNLHLHTYRQPPYSRRGFLKFSQWKSHAKQLQQVFDIRGQSLADPIARLSGGNQQKAVIARELAPDSPDSMHLKPLILAANPTRGLDVGASAFVMKQLLDARARGTAVLLIHSDLDELLAVSDRLYVLFNGKLTLSKWPHATKEQIGRLMLGIEDKTVQP